MVILFSQWWFYLPEDLKSGDLAENLSREEQQVKMDFLSS